MSTELLRLHRCPFPVSCISIEESFLVSPGQSNDDNRSTCGNSRKTLRLDSQELRSDAGARRNEPTSVAVTLPRIPLWDALASLHNAAMTVRRSGSDSLFGAPHTAR